MSLAATFLIERIAHRDAPTSGASFPQASGPCIERSRRQCAAFTFLYNWNDFLGPLIYLQSPDHFTLQLGLAQLQSQYQTHTELIMAGSTLSVLLCIVLFFICQRWFIQGVVITGVKG